MKPHTSRNYEIRQNSGRRKLMLVTVRLPASFVRDFSLTGIVVVAWYNDNLTNANNFV